MNKKVLIIGSYGASNIGDEAMLESLLNNLPESYEKWVLSGNPAETKKRHPKANRVALHFPFGLRSFLSMRWLQSIKLMKQCDRVILGGGGLLTDGESKRAIGLWSWQLWWANHYKKPIIMLGNSLGPFQKESSKKRAQKALEQMQLITVRDEVSLELAKSLAPKNSIMLGSDLAFLFNAPVNTQQKRIALNLRPWSHAPIDIHAFVETQIKNGYSMVWIAMEASDEKLLSKEKARLIPPQAGAFSEKINVVRPNSFTELLEILSTCEAAIGMRLHFLIAAALANCTMAGNRLFRQSKWHVGSIKRAVPLPQSMERRRAYERVEKGQAGGTFGGTKAKSQEHDRKNGSNRRNRFVIGRPFGKIAI
ncbi:polysaccharide pyruvyl transferase family protein [Candidatus Peregrinibacteria bacterium]|nr:MAG: polysaccharide pyruvyl transferase family protein [Candidatus Peregrinibacteria bacterium]